MKKILAILMAYVLLFSLTACGGTENTNEVSSVSTSAGQTADSSEESQPISEANSQETIESESAEQALSETEDNGGGALVVYFSATGNTRSVAETIAELQNADLYEIVPEQPYTDVDLNYSDNSSRATVEQNDKGARPSISGTIENIADYDVIYVGFPIWWGDMPRILYTFFDTYDLSGKTVIPFCTSGSSGISGAVNSIKTLEPEATVLDGLQISSTNATNPGKAVTDWLNGLDLEVLQ